jgi:hypothetical protein
LPLKAVAPVFGSSGPVPADTGVPLAAPLAAALAAGVAAPAPLAEALGAALAATLGRALAAPLAAALGAALAVEPVPLAGDAAGALVGVADPPQAARRSSAIPAALPVRTCRRVTLLFTRSLRVYLSHSRWPWPNTAMDNSVHGSDALVWGASLRASRWQGVGCSEAARGQVRYGGGRGR